MTDVNNLATEDTDVTDTSILAIEDTDMTDIEIFLVTSKTSRHCHHLAFMPQCVLDSVRAKEERGVFKDSRNFETALDRNRSGVTFFGVQ